MIALLLAALAAADAVTIKLTPEPLAVTQARLGEIRGMGAWRALICADSPVRMSAYRVEMAITDLAIIDPDSAAELLRIAGSRRARARWARVADWMFIGGTAALGSGRVGSLSGKDAAQLVGMGFGLVRTIQGRLERSVIVLDPAKLLVGEIDLPESGCTARVVFAGLVPRAQLRPHFYQLSVPVPRRPAVGGISAVPPSFTWPNH
jgi:hypothetical protein